MTRYVRNLPPTLVEACTWKDPLQEKTWRQEGKPVNAFVPVLPDGSLDWKKATGTSDLHFHQARILSVSCYNGLISKLSRAMDEKITEIRARQDDMKARAVDYEDPELLEFETKDQKEKTNG